jgi:4-hydroxy-3-polyprenylbenzoate decarboxylase
MIRDLRSALDVLARAGDPVQVVDAPVDPRVGLIAGIFQTISGPGRSWMTAEQPLQLYRQPLHGRFPLVTGLFGSRSRLRFLLDPERHHGTEPIPGVRPTGPGNAALLLNAIAAPRPVTRGPAATPRTVIPGANPGVWLPATTCTAQDPGPTITMGLVHARDDAGRANASVHRITLKRHSATIGINPTGHLARMIAAAAAQGRRLPVSVNIGLDPAVYVAAALSRPAMAYGDDELAVAGALRNRALALAPCFTNDAWFIDHAEIVIEARLGPETEPEHEADAPPDARTMPEYLGYTSPAGPVTTLHVDALSHRPDALYQAVTGPGREQAELLGAGQEAAMLKMLRKAGIGDLVRDVIASPAGGGHLLTAIRLAKTTPADDRRVVEAACEAASALPAAKLVVLVDDDVDPRAGDDLLWAIATRFHPARDLHLTAELPGTPLDPSQSAAARPGARGDDPDGLTARQILDCTVPFHLRDRFRRAFS